MPDFNQWKLNSGKFQFLRDFETQLKDVYGPIHQWESANQHGQPGRLYVYDNPHNAKREYFLLKQKSYGPFPIDGKDNEDWRYLGDMNRFVTISPHPVRTQQFFGRPNLMRAVMEYYGTKHSIECMISSGKEGDEKNDESDLGIGSNIGDVWYLRGRKEYYLQRALEVTCHDIPSSPGHNNKFFYLGSESTLSKLFGFSPISNEEFELRTLAWYGVKEFLIWADRNNPDNVGKIFRYIHKGRWDFFTLNYAGAGYFPVNQISANGWTYVGTYQPS